jgi:phage terminase Nu1 subunit (DNA packaging protein)
LRARDGAPIWVIARRTVASYVDGVPELLQATFIDITMQKNVQARLRDIIGGQSSGATPEGKSAGISGLSQRIANILRNFTARE